MNSKYATIALIGAIAKSYYQSETKTLNPNPGSLTTSSEVYETWVSEAVVFGLRC